MATDTESFVVGMGLIAILFILSIISFVSPTAATIGWIFVLPLLIFYGVLNFYPKIKNILKPKKSVGPPFDFPNHSAAKNATNKPNQDDNKKYDSGVKGESDFTNNGRSKGQSQSPRDRTRRIQEAETELDIRHPYTEKELNSAYRQKVQIHHPDKEGGSEDDFKSIQDAYELLSEEQTYTESSSSDATEEE